MDNFIVNKEDDFEKLLNKKYHFQSLLQLSYVNKLLSIKELEKIQVQLVENLTEIVGYYTKQRSSSVKNEIAEKLMLSLCYKLGVSLKNKKSLRQQIGLIKNEELKFLINEGEKLLHDKVDTCKNLLQHVKETRIQTENYAYLDTIDYGIPLFFQEYDVRFASHETPGSIDYPLAIDEFCLTGIQYIEDYLKKLILENKFCSYFSSVEIEALLKGFSSNSEHMLINIFQLVFTNCLGLALVGKVIKSLDITNKNREYLKNMLYGLSGEQLSRLLGEALDKLCNELNISDKILIQYMSETLYQIEQSISINIETDTLEKIFITLNKSENTFLKYVDGKSLDNISFRNMANEVRDCSQVKDKIGIIREEVHSLEDLVDLLGAECIFGDEFFHVFKALDAFEIALLIKRISNDEIWDDEYGTESEKEWHEKLKIYLESLECSKKEELIRMAQGIDML